MPECAAGESDLNADARVAAGGADANVAVLPGIEILGVRIEVTDHAADGAFQKLSVVDGFNVVALDPLEHLGKQARLLPVQLVLVRYPAVTDQTATDRQAKAHDQTDHNNQNCANFQ